MAFAVSWDNADQSIIVLALTGTVLLGDYYAASREQNRLLDSVTHPVCTIIDLTAAHALPNFLSAARYMESNLRKNEAGTIIVGAPAYVKALIDIGKRLAPKALGGVDFAATLAEARALAARMLVTA